MATTSRHLESERRQSYYIYLQGRVQVFKSKGKDDNARNKQMLLITGRETSNGKSSNIQRYVARLTKVKEVSWATVVKCRAGPD